MRRAKWNGKGMCGISACVSEMSVGELRNVIVTTNVRLHKTWEYANICWHAIICWFRLCVCSSVAL